MKKHKTVIYLNGHQIHQMESWLEMRLAHRVFDAVTELRRVLNIVRVCATIQVDQDDTRTAYQFTPGTLPTMHLGSMKLVDLWPPHPKSKLHKIFKKESA